MPKNYTIAIVNSLTQSSLKERDELLKSNINFEIDMSSNLYIKNIIVTKIKLYVIKLKCV